MDASAESKPQPESTTTSARQYAVKLKLNPEPKIIDLPGVRRSVDQIAPELREKIRRVVAGLDPWPLFIYGPPGVGKTCSALCVLDRCHQTDYKTIDDKGREWWHTDQPSGVYRTAHGICEDLFSEHGKRTRTLTEKTWGDWARARLTVLDEIGIQEKVGNFIYNTTKELLDLRINNEKPLIVISNLDLDTLAKLYDDRISSRLVAGTVVLVQGEDRRMKR